MMNLGLDLQRRLARTKAQTSFFLWRLSSEGAANQARLDSLRNKYQGQRCFVMGNGPSLLKCDLNKLNNSITIVSNAHYLIWDKLVYTPTFLTVEDRLVAEDRTAQLRQLNGIVTIFPFDLRSVIGDATESRLYVNFDRLYKPFPQFSFDFARIAYWGGTVSFFNMQLAAYMGCSQIIMIGFDHNYQVPQKEIVGHVIKSKEADINHIHPDYFGPGYRWHDPNVARMEIGYLHAKAVLNGRGIEVLNATVGGYLEVFPRIRFDSLFE